jgi:hypothetical protein
MGARPAALAVAVWAAASLATTVGEADETQYAVRFVGNDHAARADRAAGGLGYVGVCVCVCVCVCV